VITGDPANNVTDAIYSKLGAKLHTRRDHPICILKDAIHQYFDSRFGAGVFAQLDDLHPLVSTEQNFDQVLVPPDHVSRSPNDTYYVNAHTVLRCHTSAHQVDTLRSGKRAFLITGDVYRRDAIDATHYPVFHQMEGVRVFAPADWASGQGKADPLLSTISTVGAGGLLRDMGKTVVSSNRTFRKIQLLVPTVSTFGVGGPAPGATANTDFLTGYIELQSAGITDDFPGGTTPAQVAYYPTLY
jgi:hypothetical protein